MKKYLYICALLVLFSNCESESTKIKKSNEVVSTFMTNLAFDNYDIMAKLYPAFSKIGKYKKLKNFKISQSVINEKRIIITGRSGLTEVMFIVEKINDNYQIVESKGLAWYYNTYLYEYCKNLGCLVVDNYDIDISVKCKSKESEFFQAVNLYKDHIEKRVYMISSNVSNGYGAISGEITIHNNSILDIPGYAYNIYINYKDHNNNLVFVSKYNYNFDALPQFQKKTIHIFEQSNEYFQYVDISLKLLRTDFIERKICQSAKGKDCEYVEGL